MFLYRRQYNQFYKETHDLLSPIPDDTVWIDLHNFTSKEELLVEEFIKHDIPTREEMYEIEVSSRLHQEDGLLFMTAMCVTNAYSPLPENHAFTFILSDQVLVTLRYTDPWPFRVFTNRVEKLPDLHHNPISLFIGLIESNIDRMADILEFVGQNIDSMTRLIFQSANNNGHDRPDFQKLLEDIGRNGDLVSKTRESLVTFNRMVSFFQQAKTVGIKRDDATRFVVVTKDISALSDHATFLSNKVNFLLDATLGMINIEQNKIIKIFSVATVVFLPPTLIASIYGMNFHFLPELSWPYGYPMALSLMVLSAWLPFKYFKKKKWL